MADTKRVGDMSPWGQIEVATAHGVDGLVFVSTSSHGGFYVPLVMRERIPAEWVQRTWNSGQGARGWFEEDVDAGMVVASFPALFGEAKAAEARRYIETWLRRKAAEDIAKRGPIEIHTETAYGRTVVLDRPIRCF